MKLMHAALSPFVRKVRIAAMELGFGDRIELVPIVSSPVAMNPELTKLNPLGKLPALVTDDGDLLFDSPVIVDYLDALAGGGKVIPAAGQARWGAKRTEAICDGLCDAAILVRYETALRPEQMRWQEWITSQMARVTQSLDALEGQSWTFDDTFDVGKISIVCALGYLDVRYPDLGWRKRCETLGRWYEKIAKRPSVEATKPPPS